MKLNIYIHLIGLFIATCLFSSCEEDNSIKMPDFEVGIVANAEITPLKYWFNANDLENTEIQFELGYEGFEVHEANQIDLFISKSGQEVLLGSYTTFPTTVTLTAVDAYELFGETIADYDADGSGKDEFRFTYKITTTDGLEFSEFGQYYTYNPSLDGRFTGKYAQFYTNLSGFGILIFDVRMPNDQHPNEN